ncbi:MAG: hypothetical protein H6741_26400 [Alphaproteobacteria bacterium]|nr:hypothetical protein [Alphaproteobacteria bacterium]MCB9796240.1 hypothetical protein [Alphaproteobacteria bacterium]
MTTLLLLFACVERPEGPPPPPSRPASVDTADWGDPDAPLAQGGANRPPIIERLDITPEALRTTTAAHAVFKVRDPEDGFVTTDVAWLLNGKPIPGATLPVLEAAAFKRGDRIQARLTVSDGANEVRYDSVEVLVENSPPEIEVPLSGVSGDINGFRVVAHDVDGDRLSWTVLNGPPGLDVSSEGVLRYTPQPIVGEGKRYEAEVRVEDPFGEYASWPLTLDLRPGQEASQQPQ